MESSALVSLALKTLSCSQRELAERVGVSPTQITKWKDGEYISFEMSEKLAKLAKIGDLDPEFVQQAGSIEDATKWKRLIHYLAESAHDAEETGYNTVPLRDEEGILCAATFSTLAGMGVRLPTKFPSELDFADYDADDDGHIFDQLLSNPHAALIYDLFEVLNDVYGFFAAYVLDVYYELDDGGRDEFMEVDSDPALLDLAASKLVVDKKFAPGFDSFRFEVKKRWATQLKALKRHAIRHGIPLGAELLSLVHDSHESLGHEAEREALGFNDLQLHPDIYMNELLTGMRIVHQVLPAILKKLDIDFKLDRLELSVPEQYIDADDDKATIDEDASSS